MKRWVTRILFGAIAIVLVTVAVVSVQFASWRSGVSNRIGAESMTTKTAAGTIEYVVHGEGMPVLWLHGTPGGYDQVLRTLRLSPERSDRYRSIVPSRPGYLGTPLESGERLDEQAGLFKELLAHVGETRVAVVGTSGGGPYALELARRYPESCSALILISAVSMSFPRGPPSTSVVGRLFETSLGRDFGLWLVRESFPRSIKHIDLQDPVTREYVGAMMESVVPTSRRRQGFDNDWKNFGDLSALRLEEIRAPTLILHGTADTNVPYTHAQHSSSAIRGARLVTFDGYDHFIHVTRRKEIGAEIDAFLAARS